MGDRGGVDPHPLARSYWPLLSTRWNPQASQPERILQALQEFGTICSADLYRASIPNGRNRIGELKRRGHNIITESDRCGLDSRWVHYTLRPEED